MSQPKRYSLADVRRSYGREKAWRELTGELPTFLIYRPLSFPLSWLALRIGIPALAVTWSGLAIAIAVVVAAVRGGDHAYLWVTGLGLAFHVLDCMDGNMARTTGKPSAFGAILDGFVDATFFSALFLAMGVLVEHEAAHAWASFGVEIGLGAGLLVLLNRKVRDHYALITGQAAVFGEPPNERPSSRQWLVYALAGLENLYAPALGVAGLLGAQWVVLAGAVLYASAVSATAIYMTLTAARSRDRASGDLVAPSSEANSTQAAQHQTHVLPAEGE